MSKHLDIVQWFGCGFAAIRMIVGAMSILFLLSKGISLEELAIIKSMQYLTYVVFDIPLGYFADSKNYKLAFLASIFLSGLWLLITAVSNSLPILMFSEALNGISLALLQGAYTAYLLQHDIMLKSGRSTRTILSLFQKRTHLLMAVTAFLGAAFVTPSSNFPWLIASAFCFVWFVLSYVFLPHYSNREEDQIAKNIRNDMYQVFCQLRHHEILKILMFYLPLFLFYQLFIQFFQPFIEQYFEKYKHSGLFWGLLYLFVLSIQSFSGWVSSRIHQDKHLAIVSFSLSLVIVLTMAVSYTWFPMGVVGVCALIILQTRIVFLMVQSMFHQRLQHINRATVDSFVSTIFRIILSLVLLLLGTIVSQLWISIYILYFCLIMLHIIFLWKWESWWNSNS